MPAMDNAFALVVGIANYQHINQLPETVLKDAQDIHDLLVDAQHCGYAAGSVQLLLDGQATQAALRQALADLAQRSDTESTIFLYISSHGGRIESGPYAGEYLLPVDVSYASDQSIAQTAISGDEFTAALRAIAARKVVVVFDCCHSAGIGQPKDATAPVIKGGLSDQYYDALQAGRGRVILASSRSNEYSYVLPGAENSLFTAHLKAGLQGSIASEDGLIHIFDLFEYVQPRVTADQSKQHPIFKADLENNFPVALYLGGQKGVVLRDAQGFRYDAYISYVDKEPDTTWVWGTLVPKLKAAGLRVAVSGDVGDPGVQRVVSIQRGVSQAKRTVLVLSDAYLADNWADFENAMVQSLGVQQGTYPLLPVKIEALEESQLPLRLSQLVTLNLVHPQRAEREFTRLVQALQGPLPRRG
jgi:hypothetical protein